jgi:streptomycin 6-kinase
MKIRFAKLLLALLTLSPLTSVAVAAQSKLTLLNEISNLGGDLHREGLTDEDPREFVPPSPSHGG